jgi:hypothetical protein
MGMAQTPAPHLAIAPHNGTNNIGPGIFGSDKFIFAHTQYFNHKGLLCQED